ncbi:hypothetical protein HK096_001665, partial [Nowakowskiella sp. JEL0078]
MPKLKSDRKPRTTKPKKPKLPKMKSSIHLQTQNHFSSLSLSAHICAQAVAGTPWIPPCIDFNTSKLGRLIVPAIPLLPEPLKLPDLNFPDPFVQSQDLQWVHDPMIQTSLHSQLNFESVFNSPSHNQKYTCMLNDLVPPPAAVVPCSFESFTMLQLPDNNYAWAPNGVDVLMTQSERWWPDSNGVGSVDQLIANATGRTLSDEGMQIPIEFAQHLEKIELGNSSCNGNEGVVEDWEIKSKEKRLSVML